MSHSVACIDVRDGKVFVAKRQNKGEMANRWEFPGGKIDEGETPEQAIHREMEEEFGVKVQVFEPLADVEFKHKEKTCYVTAYKVQFEEDGLSRRFTLSEHTDYMWTEFNKITDLNFVDSDILLYNKFKDKI